MLFLLCAPLEKELSEGLRIYKRFLCHFDRSGEISFPSVIPALSFAAGIYYVLLWKRRGGTAVLRYRRIYKGSSLNFPSFRRDYFAAGILNIYNASLRPTIYLLRRLTFGIAPKVSKSSRKINRRVIFRTCYLCNLCSDKNVCIAMRFLKV